MKSTLLLYALAALVLASTTPSALARPGITTGHQQHARRSALDRLAAKDARVRVVGQVTLADFDAADHGRPVFRP